MAIFQPFYNKLPPYNKIYNKLPLFNARSPHCQDLIEWRPNGKEIPNILQLT